LWVWPPCEATKLLFAHILKESWHCRSLERNYRRNHEQIASERISPIDVYLADDAEVRNEELALGALRKRPPMPDYKQYRDLSYLLTPREISYYRYFEHLREAQETQRVASADLVYHLGDNPAKRLAWSATSGSIPTFRRSCTICWAPSLRRWLTVREKLATMGWPTYPILASALDATVQTPSQDEGRLMVGNAMHLACVGVATLASLASVKLL
jgi:hypothetical protein